MKCTPGTRFQFHLLNSRLIVYICVMRNFNKKKNALGVARLLSRLVSPLAGLRLLPPPVFLIISSDTQAISPCCF